jgi:hypothetical protein
LSDRPGEDIFGASTRRWRSPEPPVPGWADDSWVPRGTRESFSFLAGRADRWASSRSARAPRSCAGSRDSAPTVGSIPPGSSGSARNLPIVIEVVDTAERIDALLPTLDETIEDGLVTIETVRILRYRPGRES